MPSAKKIGPIAGRFALAQGDRSLRQIALAAQLSPSSVESIANGRHKNPGVLTVEKVAKALGVRAAWLAYGEGAREG